MRKLLLISIFLSILSGCGFQLKGQSDANAINIESIKLSFNESNSPIKASLRATIARNNISLSNTSKLQLSVESVTFSTRNLSLATRDEAIERELQATVSVTINHGVIITENFIHSVVYTHDPLTVLSSDRELQLQRQNLLIQLSERILRRLENLSLLQ